jgi:hypothetical protein
MPIVKAQCPNCASSIEVEYVWLGAPTKCPACGRTEIPFIPVGTVYPVTQWELSFSDFMQLLGDSNGRLRMNDLLGGWYGYTIAGDGQATTVESSAGERIEPTALHERIQGDPDKQFALYQTAMAVWR